MNALLSIFSGPKVSSGEVPYTPLNDTVRPDALSQSVTQATANVLGSGAQRMPTHQPRNSLRSFAALSTGTNGNIDDGASTVGTDATDATWDGKTVGSEDPTEPAQFDGRSFYEPSLNGPDSPSAPVDNGDDSLVFLDVSLTKNN